MFLEVFAYFKTLCYSNVYDMAMLYLFKSKLSVKMLRHDNEIICHSTVVNYHKQRLNQQATLVQWHQHKAIIHQTENKVFF